jgi:hypothetical protein
MKPDLEWEAGSKAEDVRGVGGGRSGRPIESEASNYEHVIKKERNNTPHIRTCLALSSRIGRLRENTSDNSVSSNVDNRDRAKQRLHRQTQARQMH